MLDAKDYNGPGAGGHHASVHTGTCTSIDWYSEGHSRTVDVSTVNGSSGDV